jgi:hypothetical protein
MDLQQLIVPGCVGTGTGGHVLVGVGVDVVLLVVVGGLGAFMQT